MKKSLVLAVALAILAWPAHAVCFGSGAFSSCSDSYGNSYSVHRFGSGMTTMNGYNSRTGSSWSQNSMRFGSGMTTHDGLDSDGNSWHMMQHDLGGGFSTYSGTDSNGNFFSGTCSTFGCN